jgi:hypothetical protein
VLNFIVTANALPHPLILPNLMVEAIRPSETLVFI